MRIIKAIKKWYHGQYLPHPPVSSYHCDLPIEQITQGYFKRPAIIRFLIYIKHFWIKNWKWIIGTIVPIILTMIGLYIAWLMLITPKS